MFTLIEMIELNIKWCSKLYKHLIVYVRLRLEARASAREGITHTIRTNQTKK